MSDELLITRQDQSIERVALEKDEYTFGRSHSNDVSFAEDASLSRKHMKLVLDSQGVWVEDLGSKNGTLVNGDRIAARVRLRRGDRITIGQIHMAIVEPGGVEPEQVFFDATGTMEPSATVMTSLEGLFSNEKTEPFRRVQPVAGAAAVDPHSAFDSPVVRVLFRASRELVGFRPLEELFPMILELSIEAVGAERGVLMVLDGERLVSRATHGDGFRISTTVRDRVINDKASVLVKDIQQDEAFRMQHSISAQNIHTMMAVPLQTEDRVIGLIYVDSRLFIREFSEDDLNLLTVLANVAAIRIEQQRFAQLERDGEQAAKIQRGILPSAAPRSAGVDIAGHNSACLSVGGDYYDFLPYPDGSIGLVLGDVAGKGMSAALLMSNLQARVQILGEQVDSPAEFVTKLDKSIESQCPSNRFITFFFAKIDPQTGQLHYTNAGHNPPLLVRANGTVETLETSGTVLGMLPELGYSEHKISLEQGDLLAIFSDGVTEAAGDDDVEFGEKRLANVLSEFRHLEAEEIIERALSAVQTWTGSAPAQDDVTLVVVRKTQ